GRRVRGRLAARHRGRPRRGHGHRRRPVGPLPSLHARGRLARRPRRAPFRPPRMARRPIRVRSPRAMSEAPRAALLLAFATACTPTPASVSLSDTTLDDWILRGPARYTLTDGTIVGEAVPNSPNS